MLSVVGTSSGRPSHETGTDSHDGIAGRRVRLVGVASPIARLARRTSEGTFYITYTVLSQ